MSEPIVFIHEHASRPVQGRIWTFLYRCDFMVSLLPHRDFVRDYDHLVPAFGPSGDGRIFFGAKGYRDVTEG